MLDCCIIGGGVVGLSIARELSGRGLTVRVLARESGRETASWAAAGIFPPARRHAAETPVDVLTAWSDELHHRWAGELREETGIDNGLSICGGLHVARDAQRLAELGAAAAAWRLRGARCEQLDAAGIAGTEPGLRTAVERGAIVGGLFLPEETQIRPPRHLEALLASCRSRGVDITDDASVDTIAVVDRRIDGVEVSHQGGGRETVRAATYCLAAGAWSGRLASVFGSKLETRPIRGQIALFAFPRPVLTRVVNVGLDYLVPRDDGRVLVGSTLENAGFDAGTTEEAIVRLRGVATTLLGDLSSARLERSWAGLRPGSSDGLPSIGRMPGSENGFVAAGHFRAGLHQSTGTAVLIADIVTGVKPSIDPTPFAPERSRIGRDPLMPL